VITLEVATDDISSLEGLLSEHTLEKAPSKADKVLHAIVGRIKVDVHGLSASFSRQIDINPLLLDYMGDDGLSMLGEAQFRYTIHLPKAVTTSNAHEVSNDGRTLRWVYQLAENKDKPIMLSMVASVPVPWWVWALAVLLVLALLWGLRILTGRLRSQGGRSSSM
jgi:hypothetical protein